MSNKSDPSSHGKVLEKITREFCRFREEVGGHYPEEHKSMAVSAVGMGLGRRSVAVAAGVSMGSLRNWLAKVPRARRLQMIATQVEARETPSAADLICIRLASGVEIDFPRSEVGLEFLEMLSSVRGGR